MRGGIMIVMLRYERDDGGISLVHWSTSTLDQPHGPGISYLLDGTPSQPAPPQSNNNLMP